MGHHLVQCEAPPPWCELACWPWRLDQPPLSSACPRGELWVTTSSQVIARCWRTAERLIPACTPRSWRVSERYSLETSSRIRPLWKGSSTRQTPWLHECLFSQIVLLWRLTWRSQQTFGKSRRTPVKRDKALWRSSNPKRKFRQKAFSWRARGELYSS